MNERIKQVRKNYKLSQTEFGERIGISDAAVSRLESGDNSPSERTVKLICSVFHVSYLWLTTGDGPMLEPESPEMMVERMMVGESALAISVMKAFAALPLEEWRRLRDMIDQVKGEGQQ